MMLESGSPGIEAGTDLGLEQNHEIGRRFRFQCSDQVGIFAQHRLDLSCGTVAALNPDHLGRRIRNLTALLEIRVLADYDKPVVEGKSPNRFVARAVKPYGLDVQ